jgi:L-iditol 2-dehydrogenase
VLALVKAHKGPGGLQLQDVERPVPRHGEVVLKVLGTGICGTDLHILEGTHPVPVPLVLGHEFVGEVVESGAGVEGWSIGDRVVCEPHFGACRACNLCRRGLSQHCKFKGAPGIAVNGALAAYVAVPAWLLHRVPAGMSDLAAAATEPTAVAVSAVERVGIEPGERVVVFGPGPVGLLAAMVARASGATSVTVVGRPSSSTRLELASALGLITWEVHGQEDAVNALVEAHGGSGADVVIDATGSPSAISAGLRTLRRRGRFCAVGLSGTGSIDFPWDEAMFQAIDLHFSMSSSYTSWDRALALIASGQVAAERLVAPFALADWEAAFGALERRDVAKAVIVPERAGESSAG